MVYRITGGIALGILGLTTLGLTAIPAVVTGIFLLIAGIALLAGQ